MKKSVKVFSWAGTVVVALAVMIRGLIGVYIHFQAGLGIDFADQDQFKWQVRINAIPEAPCGGVMVARQWVLTAAHCLKDSSGKVSNSQVRVIAGTRFLSEGDPMPIADKIIPAEFVFSDKAPVEYDIALIKLQEIPENTTVIRLSTDQAPLSKALFIAGWACYPHKSALLATVLQFTTQCGNQLGFTTVCRGDDSACAKTPAVWAICAGGSYIHGIPGFDMTDSGGGLTNSVSGNALLVGIANYDPRATPGCQTYANIEYPAYLAWIRKGICENIPAGSEINCPANYAAGTTALSRTQS